MKIHLYCLPILVTLFAMPAFSQGTGDVVKAVFVDEYNVKWFGTDLGLLRYDGDNWKAYKVQADEPGEVTSMSFKSGPGVLIGTNHGYLEGDNSASGIQTAYIYNTRTFEKHKQIRDTVITSTEGNFSLGTIGGVLIGQDNTKYILGEEGMAILKGDRKIWLEKGYGLPEAGLPNKTLQALGSEKDSIYVGTPSGVGRISPKTFKLGYYEGQDLVITTEEIDGYTGSSHYAQPYSDIISNNVLSILTDSDGYQWFGTNSGISLHTEQGGLDGWDFTLTTSDGLVNNTVNTIFQDSNGDIWFGTNGGVSKYVIDGGAFTNYTASNGLADNTVYDIAEDQDNILWFATANGVSSFNGSTFTTYTTSDFAKDFLNVIINDLTAKKVAPDNNLRIYPNPASDQLYVHYTKNRDMFLSVDIYDISGKQIKNLFTGFAAGGDLKLKWDLNDTHGNNVPEGIYFISLDAGNQRSTQKVVIIR